MSTRYNIAYAKKTGTYYKKETPVTICDILEQSRNHKIRIRIHYGDAKTGAAWGDTELCRVGRSTGKIQVPLAVFNENSKGGGAILDHCIVKIEHANKKRGGVIYQHKTYKEYARNI